MHAHAYRVLKTIQMLIKNNSNSNTTVTKKNSELQLNISAFTEHCRTAFEVGNCNKSTMKYVSAISRQTNKTDSFLGHPENRNAIIKFQ